MTPPKIPVELKFEDLMGGGLIKAGAGAVIETAEEPGTGGDLVTSIQAAMERANSFVTNLKELIAMWRGFSQNQPGQPGPGQPNEPYSPQPTLTQQLHRLLNIMQSVYGDITIAQLLEVLVKQHGETKLSTALKALEKLK